MTNFIHIAFTTIIICILFYLAVMIYFNGNSKNLEGFLSFTDSNLSSGEYPLAVDKPILYGDYNVLEKPHLSAFNASDIYKDYPVFPSNSLENNRIRYWTKPENGTCSRAELCGYIYDEYTPQDIPAPPPIPGWNKRVNYYEEEY
jgi:hypothetical protein